MKKTLAILLSVLMIVCALPFGAFAADAKYDRAKIAANDMEYIDSLSAEQVLNVILDWVDAQIAAVSADFDQFDAALEISDMAKPENLDGIIAYKDYLSELGGDFAELDTTALTTRTAAGSDIAFVENVIAFMADNADTFSKVFFWNYNADGQPEYTEGNFDFGKVGEFITNPDNNVDQTIVDFYNNYLIGNDIQKFFVNGIATEMNYEIKEGETFDEVIDNGIKNVVTGFLSKYELLSDKAIAEVNNDAQFDLKTEDVYTLVKKFVELLQEDNWTNVITYYSYLLDNLVRPLLKTSFGYVAQAGAETDVPADFATNYIDLAKLEEISGGMVLYRANDEKYYQITLKDGAATAAKEITYTEGFLNFTPPTVTIADDNDTIGTYTPTSLEVNDYMPKVYSPYKSMLTGTAFDSLIEAETVPAEYQAIIDAGSGSSKLAGGFNMNIKGTVAGKDIDETIILPFSDLEDMINGTLASSLDTVNELINGENGLIKMVPLAESFTISKINVAFDYSGYAAEGGDEFICQATMKKAELEGSLVTTELPIVGQQTIDVTGDLVGGKIAAKVPIIGTEIDITSIVGSAISNIGIDFTKPLATVVVDNLNGSTGDLQSILDLLDFVNTDFEINADILDFATYYDTYQGVPSQANRVLCGVLKMLLSDSGYESLELSDKEGSKDLTANIEKLCDKLGTVFSTAKDFMDKAGFEAFAEELDLSAAFASSHGFNAGMVYDLDFTNVENLYVCGIKLACDLLVVDNSGILYDIHNIIENLDTLDSMFVGVVEYAFAKVLPLVSENLEGFDYKFKPLTADQLKALDYVKKQDPAKDVLMADLVDLAYYAATWAVPVANDMINDMIATAGNEAGLTNLPTFSFDLGVEKGENWEATLTNLVDRFYELTDGIFVDEDILAAKSGDVYAKINALANNFFPFSCLFSNAGEDGKLDVKTVMDLLFTDFLDGDFDGFLALFEVKDDAIAGDKSVTKALIKASEHMVDPIFPDTVKYELYENYEPATEVQQYFTSRVNDVVIASNNMKSIDSVKKTLIPAITNLIKESGVLPFFAKCTKHIAGAEKTEAKEGTCSATGNAEYYTCVNCGAYVDADGNEIADVTTPIDPENHTNIQNVDAVAATCEKAGSTAGTKCVDCGTVISGCETVNALGHKMEETGRTAATCTTAGSIHKECANGCGKTEDTAIAALGHSFGNRTVVKAATCTEEGQEQRVCARDGSHVETRPIAKTAHTDSNGDNKCDACGATISSDFFAKVKAFFMNIINWFKSLFGF